MSLYRRPLPTTNLKFLTEIMWDGREPSLQSQAIDATLIHAQATTAPTAAQQAQMVAFESGIFTAQIFDDAARDLNAKNAKGGPVPLSLQNFSSSTPTFDLYLPWQGLLGTDNQTQARLSVARGQSVFNSSPCVGCHNTHNVGDNSTPAFFINLTLANVGGVNSPPPPVVDISGLPQFTVNCTKGPLAGETFVVTDLGRALITGQCADIGMFKVPTLRGLAGRAPYFHNGSAATLADVANFYDAFLGLNFTDQQKRDLVNFLKTL